MQRIYNQATDLALLQKSSDFKFCSYSYFFFSGIGSIIHTKKDLSSSISFDQESNDSPTGNS